jgi:hypothetical protein
MGVRLPSDEPACEAVPEPVSATQGAEAQGKADADPRRETLRPRAPSVTSPTPELGLPAPRQRVRRYCRKLPQPRRNPDHTIRPGGGW